MSLNKMTWDCDNCGDEQDDSDISYCKACFQNLEGEIEALIKENLDLKEELKKATDFEPTL
jgi:hypothetical protein